MSVHKAGQGFFFFFFFLWVKMQIFIAIFGFSMSNAVKWEQTNLALVQQLF